MTDEEILYDCYIKLSKKIQAKKKIVDESDDKIQAASITSRISLMLMRLTNDDLRLSAIEIQKHIVSAKGMYVQYSAIKGRNPDCLTHTLHQNMDELIRAVCRHEADMLRLLRIQMGCASQIDIQGIFNKKKYLKQLGNAIARNIVSNALRDMESSSECVSSAFYITQTGRRYHRADCPYCAGRYLSVGSKKTISDRQLTPCRCLNEYPAVDLIDKTYVTAFIDESIRRIAWDEEGKPGKTGSFSYIIGWGNLKNESQITEKNQIAQGIDYTGECDHGNRITELAIGKVLMTLAYDYEFAGIVHIYTDNQSVVGHWKKQIKNLRLARNFRAVKVSYIPREMNRRADKLGRTRMLLDLPINVYNEIVNKISRVQELEKQIEILEAEKLAITEIPEVIVAKRVIYPGEIANKV